MNVSANESQSSEPRSNDFPALKKLRLAAADLAALTTQGAINAELRRGKAVFKLRFRRNRRQHVRYIGNDAQFAASVEAELALLQRPHRRRRQLMALVQAARLEFRQSRQRLVPLLHTCGYYYHGTSIRQRRPTIQPTEIET